MQRTLAVLFALICLMLPALRAADVRDADKPIKPTPTEVLDKLAGQTGLSLDVLSLFLKEKPDAFDNFKDGLMALQIVDRLYNARDTDALAMVCNWQLGRVADKLADNVLPAGVVSFIGAVKLYKSVLDTLHAGVFIPALDNAIYQRYKGARGGVASYKFASVSEAFDQATAAGKYFPLKKKMYDELVKAKGYNDKLIGKKLEKQLWKQIDDFWMRKLEARYRRELFRKEKPVIEAKLREELRKAAQKIKDAVGSSVTVYVVHAAERTPIANAEVVLLSTKTGKRYFGRTNAKGAGTVLGVPPGHYRAGARAKGFETAVEKTNVIPPPVLNNVRLRLTPARQYAMVAVTVLDKATGQPIPGSRVNFMGEKRIHVRADARGKAKMLLPPGNWTVNADAYGYHGFATTVWVDPAKKRTYAQVMKLQPHPEEKRKKKEEADPDFEEYQPPETAFKGAPETTGPDMTGKPPETDYPAAIEGLNAVKAVNDWRNKTIEALRAEGNAKLDAIRKVLGRVAGKSIKITCEHCGKSGDQWWDGTGWTCPSCHATSMQLTEYPVGGGSYKSVKNSYLQRIAAVNKAADARIKALRAK